MKQILFVIVATAVVIGVGGPAIAQEIVPIGKGSYAATPPPQAGKGATEMVTTRKIYVVEPYDKPIPTNDWWTHLLIDKWTGDLWAYPLRVRGDERGVSVVCPDRWNENGRDLVAGAPIEIVDPQFKPVDARAKSWGDWTMQFRLAETTERYVDVTIGRGMPFCWLEFSAVNPSLKLPAEAKFFRRDGQAETFAAPVESFGVEQAGRSYAVYAPVGTRVSRDREMLNITFAAKANYLVIAALPRKSDLATFEKYAYSIPRDSRFDWTYDPITANVRTTWHVETQPLNGGASPVLQGFLPHHYRGTTHELPLQKDALFLTPRGTMKCAVGNDFVINYRFEGLPPHYPAPRAQGGAHDLDEMRLKDYITRYATKTEYGGDTYWGGKDLLHYAQYLAGARATDHPDVDKLQQTLRAALADWFTYTPGEKNHYFARYPNWRALIGFNESYWSYQFTDNHFHYGYFTFASAVLSMSDPEFLKEYGEMARLVAKQYANWDRKDTNFPYLRTFDPWAGHSYAGGFGSPGGNNQESSSEAMQSWAGLFLLGSAMKDPGMRDCAAMGYAIESLATKEYWFNVHGDNWSPNYVHPVVGILFNGGQAYATYFSGDPAWIHGIQWLPLSPAMGYLAQDPTWAKKQLDVMLADRAKKEGTASISKMGTALGNVVLSYELLFDPESVAAKVDELWAANDPVARDNYSPGLTYYFTHAMRTLGARDWNWHASLPTSGIYYNTKTATRTCVLWNPADDVRAVDLYNQGCKSATVIAPAKALVAVRVPDASGSKLATLPGTDDSRVSRFIDRLYIASDEPLPPVALAGMALRGPNEVRLTARATKDPRVVALELAQVLTPGASYESTLPDNSRWRFTIEPKPPLAVLKSIPAQGASRVPVDLKKIELQFTDAPPADVVQTIKLIGAGVRAIKPIEASRRIVLEIDGSLQQDQAYELKITGIPSLTFTTTPPACPPNVYGDSFTGQGTSDDSNLLVDLRNTESPHSGRCAIKISADKKDASLYLFNGKSDHGDGRQPVDLSQYTSVEFWLKGDGRSVWAKVGHPVFDQGFEQAHIQGVTQEYKRFRLKLPAKRDSINTVFAVSISAGKTIYLDDIKFVKE